MLRFCRYFVARYTYEVDASSYSVHDTTAWSAVQPIIAFKRATAVVIRLWIVQDDMQQGRLAYIMSGV